MKLNSRRCRAKYFYSNRFLKIDPKKKGFKTYIIRKSLDRLHKKINKQRSYLRFWDNQHGIRSFTYLDTYQYEGIPVHSYDMIYAICEYFDCIAVWNKVMLPDTTIAVRTITVYGYSPDIWLAKYYLLRMLVRYKYSKIHLESTLLIRGVSHNKLTSQVAKFGRKRMLSYSELWNGYLKSRIKSKYHYEKRKCLLKYLQNNVKLNYGKRKWKKTPNIKWAYCRPNTFHQNKIITYEKD